MAMTRRDFEAIAVTIKTQVGNLNMELDNNGGDKAAYAGKVLALTVRNLANDFSNSNPRFKFGQFYGACGLTIDGHF